MDISTLLGGGVQASSAEQGKEAKLPLEKNQDSAQSALFEELLGQTAEIQTQDQKKAEVLSKDGKNLKDVKAIQKETPTAKAKPKIEENDAEKSVVPSSVTSVPTFSAAKAIAQQKSEDYAEIDPRLKNRKPTTENKEPQLNASVAAMQASMPVAMAAAQQPVPQQAQQKPVVGEQPLRAVPQKQVPQMAAQPGVPKQAASAKQSVATRTGANPKAQSDLLMNPIADQAPVSQLLQDPRLVSRPQANLMQSAVQTQLTPQTTTTVVAQPIVIQMPMAIPVDVLSAEPSADDSLVLADFLSHGARPTMLGSLPASIAQQSVAGFSQSSWNGLGEGLAVASPAVSAMATKSALSKTGPSLRESVRAQKGLQRAEENISYGNSRELAQDMGLYMPQVLTGNPREIFSGANLDFAKLGRTEGAKAALDVSNPTMVASYVGGLASQGGGSVKVKVVPNHLGEVTISVEGRGKNLSVRMDASSAEAKEVLAQSLPELRQALAANKYDLASIEINAVYNDRSSGAGQEQSQKQNQPGMAWERFFEQRDQSGQYFGGRRDGAYRQYQQQWQEA